MPPERLEFALGVRERCDKMRLGVVAAKLLDRLLGALARLGDVEQRLLDLCEVSFVHGFDPTHEADNRAAGSIAPGLWTSI